LHQAFLNFGKSDLHDFPSNPGLFREDLMFTAQTTCNQTLTTEATQTLLIFQSKIKVGANYISTVFDGKAKLIYCSP